MNIVSARNKIFNIFMGSKNKTTMISFTVKGKPFKATSPDDQYWGSIKDVLLNREYEYIENFELPKFKGLVVDAGAHVGLFSLVASVFAKKVVALEPHPKNYSLLWKNCHDNQIDNVITLKKALCSTKNKQIKFYEGIDSGCNSIIQGSNTKYNIAKGITLKEIIEEYGDIDLLKLDVEGAEFEVFKELEPDYLKRIKAIVAEIHLNAGEADNVLKKLEASGFKTRALYPPLVKKTKKQLIQVQQLTRLRTFSNIFYRVTALARIKEKTFLILFANRINSPS